MKDIILSLFRRFCLPKRLHRDTGELVIDFAIALAEKLRAAEVKYGYDNGWAIAASDFGWPLPKCQNDLLEHLAKGDPRDVAIYCAFLWHFQLPTIPVFSSEIP